jgi:hypothetical protein
MCKDKRYRVQDGQVVVVASAMDVISMDTVKASLKATLPRTYTSPQKCEENDNLKYSPSVLFRNITFFMKKISPFSEFFFSGIFQLFSGHKRSLLVFMSCPGMRDLVHRHWMS